MSAGKPEHGGEVPAFLVGAAAPPQFDLEKLCKRDRLISLMLRDRKVLRLLSAPRGYGKTAVANEYACRLFAGGHVVWVDGSSPEFFGGLDGFMTPVDLGDSAPDLVVFEDVAFLDESRASSFRLLIDALISSGTEVVVTMLPSNDCLKGELEDCILLTANDLMVTERDVRMSSVGLPERERLACSENWRCAESTLFGHAPCSVWRSSTLDEECLATFFEERLPLCFLRAAFAMILVGEGSFADLGRMGIEVQPEDIATMMRDYPFLGVNPLQNEFSLGELSFGELLRSVVQSGRGRGLLKDEDCPCSACAAYLLAEGRTERAAKLVEIFFNDLQRAQWLEKHGWELLDAGEANLLESLISRSSAHALRANPSLQALQSWVCGLQGDARETLYYAKLAMGSAVCKGAEGEGCLPYALSYLAFLAFCSDEPLEFQKPVVAPMPHTAAEHVAALVCYCTDSELIRGLGILRGQLALRNATASEEVERIEREREELIEDLLVSCDRLCPDSTAFRFCLHFVFGLKSDPLREAAREYGYGIAIGLRKKGARTFTEAVLVTDLWRSGFFGVGTQGKDIRDGRLLDGASGLLDKLSRMCGRGPCAVPWATEFPLAEQNAKVERPKASKKRRTKGAERLPVANVTVFGGLEIAVGDRYIPESSWNHRALQLFTVLVLHQGRDVSRDTLFALLWPGLSKSRARDNFYTAWSHMQALLGEGPYLVRRGEFCSVCNRYVSSDVAEFNQLSRRLLTEREDATVILDIYARMETLYRGGLLPGEVGCEYIDQQREKYRSIYVDGMVAAAHKSLESKDARVALWFARRAMDEDAGREDVYYALIRAQIASGQRCSAIRTYFQCRKFLSDELGLDPSTKTEALYDQLLQSDPSLAKLRPESFR